MAIMVMMEMMMMITKAAIMIITDQTRNCLCSLHTIFHYLMCPSHCHYLFDKDLQLKYTAT